MRRSSRGLIVTIVFTLAWATGCGGPSYDGRVFRGAETHYRTGTLGGEWTRLSVGEQNDIALRHERTGAVIQSNSTCDPALDVPLAALRNHLLIGFTERELEAEALIALDGREALRTRLVAKLDGVSRRLELVVLKKDGCVYDFAAIAPADAPFEAASSALDAFLRGFTTELAR